MPAEHSLKWQALSGTLMNLWVLLKWRISWIDYATNSFLNKDTELILRESKFYNRVQKPPFTGRWAGLIQSVASRLVPPTCIRAAADGSEAVWQQRTVSPPFPKSISSQGRSRTYFTVMIRLQFLRASRHLTNATHSLMVLWFPDTTLHKQWLTYKFPHSTRLPLLWQYGNHTGSITLHYTNWNHYECNFILMIPCLVHVCVSSSPFSTILSPIVWFLGDHIQISCGPQEVSLYGNRLV
jgi:hypothetical protein